MCVVPGLRSTVLPLPAWICPLKVRFSARLPLMVPVMLTLPTRVPSTVPVGMFLSCMFSAGSAAASVWYVTLPSSE